MNENGFDMYFPKTKAITFTGAIRIAKFNRFDVGGWRL